MVTLKIYIALPRIKFKLFTASHGVCAICYNKHVACQLVKQFITLLPITVTIFLSVFASVSRRS